MQTGVSVGVASQNISMTNDNATDRKHNNAVAALAYCFCQGADLIAGRNTVCAAINGHLFVRLRFSGAGNDAPSLRYGIYGRI
jgi:hypothetical protein